MLYIANYGSGSALSLTTTGTSGVATLVGSVLNIPNYSAGSGGITRTITSIAVDTTAGATASVDYVYLMTGSHTLTLPTAVGNTNQYSAKAVSGTTTVATTSSQTINGSLTVTILAGSALTFISDNANWHVV